MAPHLLHGLPPAVSGENDASKSVSMASIFATKYANLRRKLSSECATTAVLSACAGPPGLSRAASGLHGGRGPLRVLPAPPPPPSRTNRTRLVPPPY